MKTGILVHDAMTLAPIKVSKEENLEGCAKIMAKNKLGSLIVMEGSKLAGIITEGDFVRKVASLDLRPSEVKVKDVMTQDPLTISPDKDIFEAIVFMRDHNVRFLPVMDEEKLVGFLTTKDILKIEPQLFDILVEKLEIREGERKLEKIS